MAQETSDGVPIADGFDYPVGPRGAADVFKTHKIDTVLADQNYHKNLGYWHPGEDWNGRGGGNTDLGDPIYAIANGKVIEFGHYPVWGNIVLLEHVLPDNSRVWSQYAHLQKILVDSVGQKVKRGRQIGTMGKGDKDRYIAHLHFEIRKKRLPISNWSPMVKDREAVLANYHAPTEFIKNHRTLAAPKPQSPARPPVTTPAQPGAGIVQLVLDTQQSYPRAGGFYASQDVGWNRTGTGYKGNMLWVPVSAQQQTHWGEWRPSLPNQGVWEVWVYVPKFFATTTYARYQISHQGGQSLIPVNQRGNNGNWEILGRFQMGPGQGIVRLTNVTGELTQKNQLAVSFDTVCWTQVG